MKGLLKGRTNQWSPWIRVAISGALSLVLYDAIAAAVFRLTGFPYSNGLLGSFIIYIVFCYYAARALPRRWVRASMLTGIVLGATDETLGWAVAWAIGPGRTPTLTPALWTVVALTVTATSSVIAGLGGLW